jgi:hypothetical protein
MTARICRASEYFSVIPEMVTSPNSAHCMKYLIDHGQAKVTFNLNIPEERE